MLETGRRTVISTSQLGLYSDYGDQGNSTRYGSIARKIAIGAMVMLAVILVAIFFYDFTSATSMNIKSNQETKHMYILQNSLKKSLNATTKVTSSTVLPEVNKTSYLQDRSDDGDYSLPSDDGNHGQSEGEYRSQNLNNFKLRKRILKSVENNMEDSAPEGKQLFDNHALVYRVKQRYKYPDSNEEDESSEESRPTPFHWELKTPQPTAFKRQRYPQLSQYKYPHYSRNIQDIIKYLSNDAELPNRGIKFTGVYVNPKKYDLVSDLGEMMSNTDRSEEDENSASIEDPFYQYKPKHPTDVNLLATSNVRFSPSGVYRYNPYYDMYGRPVNYNKQPSSIDSQYENPTAYSGSYGKKRKPKPFSVMLDIYPITDIMEQNKKTTKHQQVPSSDYEVRRPIQFNRGHKFYAPPVQPMGVLPSQSAMDEEERQQMIFHLNLFPRKKSKMSRHDIIHRSESLAPEERQQFASKVWSPLETIAKHLAVERSKLAEEEETGSPVTRYQETPLDIKNEGIQFQETNGPSASSDDSSGETITVPSNHKSSVEEDYASTEKYEFEAQKIVGTTVANKYEDSNTTILPIQTTTNRTEKIDHPKNIDTIEGFKEFSDSISKN
ncbi:uncharacterized protein LOC143183159 [Calliopsis andreniformis]|uniref:uncharacterized protein LOC143183159 n=1 Tax=Calliopsis andreniformis TaxID=337506 RepID=UPI003FCDF8A8